MDIVERITSWLKAQGVVGAMPIHLIVFDARKEINSLRAELESEKEISAALTFERDSALQELTRCAKDRDDWKHVAIQNAETISRFNDRWTTSNDL